MTGNLFNAGYDCTVVGAQFIVPYKRRVPTLLLDFIIGPHFIECCRFPLMGDDQVGVDADEGKAGYALSAGNTLEQEAVRALCRFTIGREGCLKINQDVTIKWQKGPSTFSNVVAHF